MNIQSDKVTQVFLITGFLGAGKTSFLKNILKETKDKVGVLVNEFGKISIDGPLLRLPNTRLIELNNGSIFCSCIKEHFIQSLKEMIMNQPEKIFIESSGLADPSNMVQIVELIHKEITEPFEYKGSICLVDGLYFEQELKKMVSVERQIKHSQGVLVNKIDLICSDQVEAIHAKIREINDHVPIWDVQHGEIDIKQLELSQSPITCENTTNKEENRPYVIMMRLEEEVEPESLQCMIEEIKYCFYRIKGIIRYREQQLTLDTVMEKLNFGVYEGIKDEEQVLVFISSVGVTAVANIVSAAEKWIPGMYELIS